MGCHYRKESFQKWGKEKGWKSNYAGVVIRMEWMRKADFGVNEEAGKKHQIPTVGL